MKKTSLLIACSLFLGCSSPEIAETTTPAAETKKEKPSDEQKNAKPVEKKSVADKPAAEAPAEKKIEGPIGHPMNTAKNAGKAEITVLSAVNKSKIKDSFFSYEAKSGAVLKIIKIKVKNTGKEELSFWNNLSLKDSTGREFSPHWDCNKATSDKIENKDLNPGIMKKGNACFEVPKSADGLVLVYSTLTITEKFDIGEVRNATEKSGDSSAAQTASSADQAVPRGKALKFKDMKISILEAKHKDKTRDGYSKHKAPAGATLKIINFKVENTGKEQISLGGDNFRIVDSMNREFKTNFECTMAIPKAISWGDKINPGLSLEGNVCFEVPKTADQLKVEVRSNSFMDSSKGYLDLGAEGKALEKGEVVDLASIKAASNPEAAGALNERIKVDKMVVTLLEVSNKEKTKSGYSKHKASAGATLKIVKVKIENMGTEQLDLGGGNFKIQDSKKRQFETNTDCTMATPKALAWEKVNPGLSLEGNICFEVPKSADALLLEASDAKWGDSSKGYISLGEEGKALEKGDELDLAAIKTADSPSAPGTMKEPIKVESMVVNLLSVTDKTSTRDGYSKYKAVSGATLKIVEVKITNAGSEQLNIMDNFKLYDSHGREFSSSSSCNSATPKGLSWEEINPGLSQQGKVCFEIPKSAGELLLKIETGGFRPSKGFISLGDKGKALEKGSPFDLSSVSEASSVSSAAAVGTAIKVEELVVTAKSSKSVQSTKDGYSKHKASEGMELYIVNVKLLNAGKEKFSLQSGNFKLIDDQNREFDSSFQCNSATKNGIGFDSLNPGLSLEGNICFEVPKGVGQLYLRTASSSFNADYGHHKL